MLVKPDVNLVARMLISQHGGSCLDLAEKKADELDAAGNTSGLAYWRKVLCAIEQELAPPLDTIHH